jgi:hypothetical protein
MKTFAEYLVESKQNYDYRVKIAGDLPDEFLKNIEERMKQFEIVKKSAVKTTPVQKKLPDFPAVENDKMTFFDVTFAYPATDAQIKQFAQLLGVSPDRVMLQTVDHAESIDKERKKQEEESKDLLTNTDYPTPDADQKALSKDHQAVGEEHQVVVKNAYKSKFEVAGGKTPPAKTTSDYPMGTKSAIPGTNKRPTPSSFAR